MVKELFDLEDAKAASESALPAVAPAPGALSPIEVLFIGYAALRYRWLAAVAVGAPLACLLVLGGTRRLKPGYAAEALVEVAPTMPSVAFTDEQWRAQSIHGFYDNYMRTLMRLAKVRPVLEGATARLLESGVEWLPDSVAFEEAADHLGARVQVSAVRETHLFTVRFEDGDAALVAPVANAVTAALLDYLEVTDERQRDQRRASISGERERLRLQLRDTYAALEPMSAQLGSALIDERHNVFFERLNTLTEGMSKVFVDRVRKEGELAGVRELVAELVNSLPKGELESLVDSDRAVVDARVTQGRLTREIESTTGALSGEHPERVQALQRLASAKEQVLLIEDSARARIRARLTAQRSERAAELLVAAEGGVSGARWSEERMRTVLREAEVQLEDHGRAQIIARELRTEADRLLAAMRMLDQRVDELHIEANAAPRVVLRSAAVAPRRSTGDKRAMGSVMALVFSMMLGIACAMALELSRRPVRRAEELAWVGATFTANGKGPERLALQLSQSRRPTLILGLAGVDAKDVRSLGVAVAGRLSVLSSVRWFDLLPRALDGAPDPSGVSVVRPLPAAGSGPGGGLALDSLKLPELVAESGRRGAVLGTALAAPGEDALADVRYLGFDLVVVAREHVTPLAHLRAVERSSLTTSAAVFIPGTD